MTDAALAKKLRDTDAWTCNESYLQDLLNKAAEALERAEADNAALRQLLADMKPHWNGFTRKVIWTAQMAGVMADLRTRLDTAITKGDKP